MKYLKIISLFLLPTGWAAMCYLGMDIIGTQFDLFTGIGDYTPLMLLLSAFAFIGFFLLTAENLYPSHTIVLPIKRDIAITELQPCTFEVIRPLHINNTPLFISLNA